MSSAPFGTYLRPLVPLDYTAGVFTLGASNRLNSQKVAEEYGPRIASLLRGVYGQTVHVRVAVMNSDYPPALARVWPAMTSQIVMTHLYSRSTDHIPSACVEKPTAHRRRPSADGLDTRPPGPMMRVCPC